MHPAKPDVSSLSFFQKVCFYEEKLFVAFGFKNAEAKEAQAQYTGNYMTFCLCHKGSATIQVNDYKRELTPGAQIAIIPNTHARMIQASKDFDCSFISISPEIHHEVRYANRMPLIDALLFFKEQTPIKLSDAQQEFFIKLRDILILAINITYDPYKQVLLTELIQSFLVWEQTTIAAILNSTFVTNNNSDLMATRFIGLVNRNFKTHHRLDFYADLMCITPKYLSAIVKTATGHTASQWINIFLISEAQNLLSNSDKSIADISDMLGFSNQSFFGKFFKHHKGKSPLAYRLNKD